MVADGFDIGPFKCDRDALKEQVKRVALNPSLGGGAFRITFGGQERGTRHGVRERFVCDKKGYNCSKGCGCLWDIVYEDSTDGWVLQRYPHLQHHMKQIEVRDDDGQIIPKNLRTEVSLVVAHLLIQPDSMAEIRTTSAGRQIPQELREIGVLLSKICTPAQTHHGLQHEVSYSQPKANPNHVPAPNRIPDPNPTPNLNLNPNT